MCRIMLPTQQVEEAVYDLIRIFYTDAGYDGEVTMVTDKKSTGASETEREDKPSDEKRWDLLVIVTLVRCLLKLLTTSLICSVVYDHFSGKIIWLFLFPGSINDNQISSCMCCKGMAFIGCNLLSNTGAVCLFLSRLRKRVHGWDNQKEQLNPTIVVCLRIFSIFWSNSVTLQ